MWGSWWLHLHSHPWALPHLCASINKHKSCRSLNGLEPLIIGARDFSKPMLKAVAKALDGIKPSMRGVADFLKSLSKWHSGAPTKLVT